MAEIYIADIEPLYDTQLFEEKYRQLSKERQARVQKSHVQKDKCRSMGAALLLEYGLRQRGFSLLEGTAGMQKVTLAKGVNGKPYIEGQSLYFNLSHSGEYVAAAFAAEEIGIDIEQIRSAKLKLAKRFFTREEYQYLEHTNRKERDRVFTELWTRKESYIKAVGKGMSLPLHDFSVLDGTIPFLTWDEPSGYCLSVCGRNLAQSVVLEIDLQNSI